MRPREVADRCSVTAGVVNRWIRQGLRIQGRLIKLRAVAYGDRFRVRPSDLDAFRDECTRAKLGDEASTEPQESPSQMERRFKASQARLAALLDE